MTPIKDEYQGWANPQTWCVALYIDNDKELLSQAIEAVKDAEEYPSSTPKVLGDVVLRAKKAPLYNIAPWCWDDGQSLDDVNWNELVEHYKRKRSEGVT